ncbi:hypothetical protein QEW_4480 [Clostridioides difficile CD160]|nr:hypothetical protein QEW_4480 [Clostridioides difficile CD160]
MVNLMMNVLAGLISCWLYDKLKTTPGRQTKSGWELNIKFRKNSK